MPDRTLSTDPPAPGYRQIGTHCIYHEQQGRMCHNPLDCDLVPTWALTVEAAHKKFNKKEDVVSEVSTEAIEAMKTDVVGKENRVKRLSDDIANHERNIREIQENLGAMRAELLTTQEVLIFQKTTIERLESDK